MTSAFHFDSLVWDWPIAIYLFLIGISAGLVTLTILLRRYHPTEGNAKSLVVRTTLLFAPLSIMLGLVILIFHLTRPWTFWKLMFHYNLTSVMSMGVLLFQVYTLVLVVWLALIFRDEITGLQQRWLPKLTLLPNLLARCLPLLRVLENLMLILAVLLGAYTGFLLSALQSYPMLNNPVLPALFLFSGISSAIAVVLLVFVFKPKSDFHSQEMHFLHRVETPVVWLEIFLLAAFFIGMGLGDEGKLRALSTALGGGFWAWWFWLGVVGLGLLLPLLLKAVGLGKARGHILLISGSSLCGVLLLRYFILYAGQMTVA